MSLLPPPQYDVPPAKPVIERVLPWAEVQKPCFDLWARYSGAAAARAYQAANVGWNGCAMVIDGKCHIWRIDDARVARHERGHCNGWPESHPGGRL